jgi:hypothetical protein
VAERTQLHRAVGERPQAKRDVDALADEVDAFVGEAEVDADVGIAILKGEDRCRDSDPERRRSAG